MATQFCVAALALAYHSVSPSWSHELAVTPQTFRAQIEQLARRGYVGVRFRDLADGAAGRMAVAITFDDGFLTVFEHAKPILDEFGWPATVFVVTDAPDRTPTITWLAQGSDAGGRTALGWKEVERLSEAGWEIGSHTCTHRLLSALGEQERDEELERSRARIVDHVGSCDSVSYPWGEVDDVVVAAARAAGYRAGSGLAGRFSRNDPLRVPRFAIAASDGRARYRLKTSPLFGRVRETGTWTLLDRVRRPDRPLGVLPGSTRSAD